MNDAERHALWVEIKNQAADAWQALEVNSQNREAQDKLTDANNRLHSLFEFDRIRAQLAAANAPAEPTITITRDEYESLLEDSAKLEALEAQGVDNWPGYEEAMSSMSEHDE